MAQQTPEVLLKRAAKAKGVKSQWQSLLSDAYEYFLPQRNLYHDTGDGTGPSTQGQRRVDRVFDSTGQTAMINFANTIQSKLMPAFQKWIVFKAGPMVPEEEKEAINRKLEEVTNQFFAVIQSSNFDTAINETLLDLGIGTGAMLILPGTVQAPVNYIPVPLAQIALIEGPWGGVEGVVRWHKVKAMNIMGQWSDAELPGELSEKAKDPDKGDEYIKLVEITYVDRDLSGGETWYYEVIHEGTKARIVARTYNTNPWVTPRWIKVAGETYGRGPAIQALPDAKTLNKIVELVLKGAALHISGVYTGIDDGVLNPNNVSVAPGVVIPVAYNGGPKGPSLLPLERTGSFDLAQLEHEKLVMQIKGTLFDKRLPEQGGRPLTATEIIQRVRELANDIGSPFGRLMRELIVPMAQRTLDIMEAAKLVPEIRLNGLTVSAVVVAPLAMEQNLAEVEAVVRWLDILKTTGGDQLVQLGAVIEDIPDWIGERLGVPSTLRRNETDRKLMQEMAGKMAAQGGVPMPGAEGAPAINQGGGGSIPLAA